MLNYEYKKLRKVLKAFYNATGARVAIYNSDFLEVASYPANPCILCSTLRTVDKIDKMCKDSDKQAFQICKETSKMHSYKCKMGLFEAVAPIIIHQNLEGYIMMGQVLSSRKEVIECTKNFTQYTSINALEINAAISQMETISFERVESICFLMNICVEYLCMNHFIQKANPRAMKIDSYLESHLDQKLYADDIANAFYISRSTLHNILQDAYNMSLTERINYLRIERVKRYLSEDISIDDICAKTGYNDKSFLFKNFKKYTGCTIKEYLFVHPIPKRSSYENPTIPT